MTFLTLETSIDDGRPTELYEFKFAAQAYYYTSAAEQITRQNFTYTPVPINRDQIKAATTPGKQSLSITGPADLPVADLFRTAPPSNVVTLTIYRQHFGDTDFTVYWSGRVTNASWKDNEVTLTAESALTSLNRLGLRRQHNVLCPHQLYGVECGLVEANFRVDATVLSVAGNALTTNLSGYADNWFAGGFIEWVVPNTGNTEIRSIQNSTTAGGLTLISSPPGLLGGQTIRCYPGCDKSLSTCKTKYNNVSNNGSYPFSPSKNPFGGIPIF